MKKTIKTALAALLVAAVFSAWSAAGEVQDGQTQAPDQQQQQQQQGITQAELFILMAGEAEKGNPEAMLTLGSLYERGIGTSRNFVKAFEWYNKAANAGLPAGYYNVGVCWEIGMGTTGDMAKAFSFFEKAAENNLPQGFYKLASLYFTGTGTAKNEAWGVELLNRAAGLGHMAAANDLGVIAFEGGYGQPKDVNKAFDWFRRSAEMGNAEAMKNLAVFYRDGLGGQTADPIQEMKWYVLARAAGFPAQAINPAIAKLRESLTEDEIKRVEADAQAWVTAFQEKQRAQQAPQQK